MKKLLAVILAAIMVLSLSIVTFADLKAVKVIELEKEEEVKELEDLELLPEGYDTDEKTNETTYIVFEDGVYYIPVDAAGLKDLKATVDGNIEAELVEFDPAKQKYDGVDACYFVVDTKGEDFVPGEDIEMHFFEGHLVKFNNGKTFNEKDGEVEYIFEDTIEAIFKSELTEKELEKVHKDAEDLEGYELAEFYRAQLAKIFKSTRFAVKVFDNGDGEMKELNKDLLKITVPKNFGPSFKEGKVALTAVRKADKKKVIANLVIVSDVIIFERNEVKWAADEKENLVIGDPGYSDYYTYKFGYGYEYNEEDLRVKGLEATVVATTEFRAVAGKALGLETKDGNLEVLLKEVAAGQKGVNFAYKHGKLCDSLVFLDKDGKEIKEEAKLEGKVASVEFGFLGSQKVDCDFTIKVDLDMNYYELRELFGVRLEENDVVDYYVMKDGKLLDKITIDYADIKVVNENVKFDIAGKAGETLGYYTIALVAPAEKEVEGETNPDTGASVPMVGVVSALAVISLASAAAISLKK